MILWLIVGILAGTIAKKIMKEGGGWLSSLLLGIGGGMVGGFIGNLLGLDRGGFFWSTLVAVAGACLLIWLYRVVAARRR